MTYHRMHITLRSLSPAIQELYEHIGNYRWILNWSRLSEGDEFSPQALQFHESHYSIQRHLVVKQDSFTKPHL